MRARASRRWVWVVVLLLGCVLAGMQTRPRALGPASLPAEAAAAAARPAESLMTGVGGVAHRIGGFFSHVMSLERENAALRERLEAAQANNERLAEALQETQRLRALLGLRGQVGGTSVAARAIGRSPSPWFRTLDLNVGRADGVRPGCAVVAPGGLVGQVYRVAAGSAKVLCLVDRQGSVGVRLQPDRARQVVGVCKGDGAELLTLTFGDPTAPLRPGDAVVTSGHESGSGFPAGLLVGHVVAAEARPQEQSVVAVIRPAVDMGRVEEVLVLLTPEVRP